MPFQKFRGETDVKQLVQRFHEEHQAVFAVADDEDVSFGQIVVQLGSRVLVRNGEETLLTTGEFALLKVLLQHPRQPLSRDRLMELARGREYDVFDRSIDVHISALRKKLGDDPKNPRFIRTYRGAGYMLINPEAS